MNLQELIDNYPVRGNGLWYLASPYSKYTMGTEQAYRDVSKVAGELMKVGVDVFCPIAHSHPIAVHGDLSLNDHDFWLPHDELHMERCAGIIVAKMPTYERSYGVNYEIEWFRNRGRMVAFLDMDGILWPPVPDEAEVNEAALGKVTDALSTGDATAYGFDVGREEAVSAYQPRLPEGSAARKDTPLASGLLDYFPDALAYVAQISKWGNDKHNPGQPLHHARGKSNDHADCIARHLVDRGTLDSDGRHHSGYLAWRALALLQEELEQVYGLSLPRGAKAPELESCVKDGVTREAVDRLTPDSRGQGLLHGVSAYAGMTG